MNSWGGGERNSWTAVSAELHPSFFFRWVADDWLKILEGFSGILGDSWGLVHIFEDSLGLLQFLWEFFRDFFLDSLRCLRVLNYFLRFLEIFEAFLRILWGFFGILRGYLGFFWIFWDFCSIFEDFLGFFGIFWDSFRFFEQSLGILSDSWWFWIIFWDSLGFLQHFWGFLGFFGILAASL